ncbi:MAG: hypothetical protein GY940_29450 [bacterium]|nr:hypothetical protein [bacterium]
MKISKKTVKTVLINVVILLLLLELAGVVIYFVKHKTFFHAHRGEVGEPLEYNEEPGRQLTNKRFHPFFGYTYKAGLKNTNNYGFDSPLDFPVKKENPNTYIIGIFGGSVAEDFYVEGRERLTEQLLKHSYFADKEIVYLNFALGGYKQPQQVQILTYFLSIGQSLDMAINIDGFNEIMFCFNNDRLNVDIAMPSAQHFLPMRDLMDRRAMTAERMDSIVKIRQYKQTYNKNRETLINTPLASVYVIWEAVNQGVFKKYKEEIVRFDGLIKPAKAVDSIVNVKYTRAAGDEAGLLKKVLSLWAESSLLMNRAMQGRGRYFHFLQPNQYHSKKTFSAQEQKSAIDHQLAYSFLVKLGYPVFLEKLEELRRQGLPVFSAAGIFDDIKETLFIDNCCHFNRLGHERFAGFIAERITLSGFDIHEEIKRDRHK